MGRASRTAASGGEGTAIAAVSVSPSKVKAQPKHKQPLPELNPEMRMAAGVGATVLARAGE